MPAPADSIGLWRSTAQQFLRRYWRVNSSGMSEALSLEQLLQEWGAFKPPIEVRSFSTKLENCRLNFSPSCCVCFKSGNSNDSGARKPLESMCGSWRQPIKISGQWLSNTGFALISITD